MEMKGLGPAYFVYSLVVGIFLYIGKVVSKRNRR